MYRIVGSLTLNSPRTPTWTKLLWHVCFLHEHITAFLSSGARECKHFNTTLGATLNSEITNKKHKSAENMAPSGPWKGHLSTVWELKRESLALPLLGMYTSGDQLSSPSAHVHEFTTKVLQALIWELYVNSSEQENSRTQRLGIMNINSIWWGFVCVWEWLEGC